MAFSERLQLDLLSLAHGAGMTLQLVSLSVAAGFLLSFPLVWMRLTPWRWLDKLSRGYTFLVRGTPLLVQIYLLYFGLSQFAAVRQGPLWNGFLESPFWCALLALSLNAAGYKAEILHGALRTVAHGDIEAAQALGMSRWQVFWRIRFRQAAGMAVPMYGNEIILLLKGSSLASAITLVELTGAARTLVARTYEPLVWFFLAGMMYLAMTTVLVAGLQRLERRLLPWKGTA